MEQTRERTLEDGSTIIQRLYKFWTGMEVWCPARSCVFCDRCTDVWFDSHGPYMYACTKERELGECITEKGHTGECEYFICG